jgi:hypothetical protein
MAVKYQCAKCGRRYIEWGAEKLNYLCPCADGAELVRVGSPEDKASKKPSLKRAARRPAPARRVAPVEVEEEAAEVDEVEVTDVEDEVEEEEEEVEVGVAVVGVLEEDIEEETEELVDEDDDEEEVEVVEDLDFSDISSSLPAKPDHDEEEEWPA